MREIKLSPRDFAALLDMLENPPEPTAALIELMQRKAPWDEPAAPSDQKE